MKDQLGKIRWPGVALLVLAMTGGMAVGQEILGNVRVLEVFQECPDCPEMVVLPLGGFLMGGEPLQPDTHGFPITMGREDPLGAPWEGPVHQVQIDIPIAIGRYEVTFEQWMACVSDGACQHQPSAATSTRYGNYDAIGLNPVRRVSYLDIQEYIGWLNGFSEDGIYRLPTEAEWEYAARAGATTLFHNGNSLDLSEANFWDGESYPDWRQNPEIPGQLIPIPVGRLIPNAWGLHDTAGNVREVTMSCYTERHQSWPTSTAYLNNAMHLAPCIRVLRDGSFNGTQGWVRPQSRFPIPEDGRSSYIGFRVVRELQ
ncbi:formylglycine-generating enzyme family protein [Roseofilum sp. BLCC_M154]|uniref:Formylglycine-generating enzyme family protein n=1 Tax=Roseofilum acuticapitatum BLCC-M154 TaxID=3022444 RepID=A0ABT7ARE6_9CYAN|nr:formylglycine-generating enzyme family protein [Roseofilum acuticapitatum]MDJ1169483.1 formylglycine-generating enzyme family protein [Roseofilum acuticapitatum BLCC-M154]